MKKQRMMKVLLPLLLALALPSSAQGAEWQKTDEGWRFLDEAGVPLTGWQRDGGLYYYMNGEGIMADSELTKDGTRYTFDRSGAMRRAFRVPNDGGGAFEIGFYDDVQQELADILCDDRADVRAEDDDDYLDDENYDENGIRDFDRLRSFQVDGFLQKIAEERLAGAIENGYTRAYDGAVIPSQGTITQYLEGLGSHAAMRRHMEIYLPSQQDAEACAERLLSRYGEDRKKRTERLHYYRYIGIAYAYRNGKYHFMLELMR